MKLQAQYPENEETTPGGHALKFYASVRLSMHRGKAIKDGDDIIGAQTTIKMVKNRLAPIIDPTRFGLFFFDTDKLK